MGTAVDPRSIGRHDGLVGQAPPSPAGPLDSGTDPVLPPPPSIPLPRALQVLRFNQRQIQFVFRARREHGEVFRMRGIAPDGPVITSHPDHVRSLFTAKPEEAPSLTAESPLRPIVHLRIELRLRRASWVPAWAAYDRRTRRWAAPESRAIEI